MKNEIIIRRAELSDADFIGRVVAMAVELDDKLDNQGNSYNDIFSEVAAKSDSQYSYNNALVATVDDRVVGALVSYDGAKLKQLRESTLSVLHRYHPNIKITEDETDANEYYLDSLGVLPQYRGMGIGRKLLLAQIDRAVEAGYKCIGLLVDFDNPDAERLYKSLGFERVGTRNFFGRPMKHMQKTL